jgi:hypothetical protein
MWVTVFKALASEKVENVLVDMEVPNAVATGAVAADEDDTGAAGVV